MRILVIGVGYVGRALALLCSRQHEVFAYDIDEQKALALKNADCNHPIHVIRGSLDQDLGTVDFALVCVPTDFDEKSHQFDTSKVDDVVANLATLGITQCIVIKSTLPVGHTASLQKRYPNQKILFSPEFLREAHAVEDCLHPSRIVVGYEKGNESSLKSAEIFANLLQICSEDSDSPIHLVGTEEAEAAKLFANTYLAMRVAYFNELDTFALFHELSAKDIVDIVSADPRIGNEYNNPSFGYGGYCLPKDSKELLHGFASIPQTLIEAVVSSNKTRKDAIAKAIVSRAKEIGGKPLIGIYRLTMKKGADNLRQSAILDIMAKLKEANLSLCIYEPSLTSKVYDGVPVVTNIEDFKTQCDLIVANRFDDVLVDISDKLFTRDLYYRD